MDRSRQNTECLYCLSVASRRASQTKIALLPINRYHSKACQTSPSAGAVQVPGARYQMSTSRDTSRISSFRLVLSFTCYPKNSAQSGYRSWQKCKTLKYCFFLMFSACSQFAVSKGSPPKIPIGYDRIRYCRNFRSVSGIPIGIVYRISHRKSDPINFLVGFYFGIGMKPHGLALWQNPLANRRLFSRWALLFDIAILFVGCQ